MNGGWHVESVEDEDTWRGNDDGKSNVVWLYAYDVLLVFLNFLAQDDCLRSRDIQHQDGAGLEVLQVAIVLFAISDKFLNEKTLQTPRHIWTETVDAEKVST